MTDDTHPNDFNITGEKAHCQKCSTGKLIAMDRKQGEGDNGVSYPSHFETEGAAPLSFEGIFTLKYSKIFVWHAHFKNKVAEIRGEA